ncbi:hypothetical protein [Rhizobium mesosinicum]|uniref:Uncharacterized protein n=1 Tax=Rhizobium mesosinicum TaxID=335017 RepID=A0ABS7GX74_9HYPH|nr:hypothetical protein [Rhizobium mesosinicum]MBW9054558.1 hypothetical protein [Rhizobium mesosinicum]
MADRVEQPLASLAERMDPTLYQSFSSSRSSSVSVVAANDGKLFRLSFCGQFLIRRAKSSLPQIEVFRSVAFKFSRLPDFDDKRLCLLTHESPGDDSSDHDIPWAIGGNRSVGLIVMPALML